MDEPAFELSYDYLAIPELPFLHAKECTTMVDKSGVHLLTIRYCKCPNAAAPDKQLFAMGMFPASFSRPKLAFMFSVLDNFLLDNLECGISAMNYYSKLRRMTSSIFPHLVPDQYRELMQVGRQWHQLKLLKWNGFAHKRKQPHASELALFCPACPQPSINAPQPAKREENDPEWLYARSLVMDGNFKAEHLHPTHPEDKVWLTDGQCFMVTRDQYKAHLAGAKENAQMSECNNHWAVNQANASRHRLEATGIGGCACARHGCFVPHSIVDFQKGEQHMNMDYALCHALSHHTDGLSRALTFYDVNCQYNKYFRHRVNESQHLSIPAGMEIVPGIGLWHVHGHQDKCYVRYASMFITRAARIDGEIMETLWVPLNIISPSARGMSTPHRQECLDYQMNDSNFMKMIRMSGFLCRKYRDTVKGVSESMAVFEKLTETADHVMVETWEEQDRQAQISRTSDPSAMDVFQELALLSSRAGSGGGNTKCGAATWIASGITIEELQISLLMDIRRLGKHSTKTQHLEIVRRRTKLQSQIDEFTIAAVAHLGEDFDLDDDIRDMEIDFINDSDGDGDRDTDSEHDSDDDLQGNFFHPEKVVIPLPSNIGIKRCTELGVAQLVGQEVALREGQANDTLQAIRVLLADKAVLFRTTVHLAKSQAKSTRAWTQVHSVEKVIRLQMMIYSKCWLQLGNLEAHNLLEKYLRMEKSHLKATAAVADPNARGQRNSTLPWFWSLDVQGDSISSDWMNEFYRVHWLCTKALRDRWSEGLQLIEHEMGWTLRFFLHKASTWLSQITHNGDPLPEGHKCYAIWQAHMYHELAKHARASFLKANPMFKMIP
ncbi:uncharacterized protein F5147DRAFT_771425 [Suillus discolor]|uniref:CxC2-like cysteine cluster KDZ transposase-associated domain-containing protein n=1 Tax=Suillus discolor TaxID=1912936 RepID=A0A9P7FCH8_9AGAM|nr:uncharacterized protein F5147DRAFT_771425 [Suillus discolor]KAG2112359.1 hypothetical protein F5147DRAFT_771425 [Suillus discolor]